VRGYKYAIPVERRGPRSCHAAGERFIFVAGKFGVRRQGQRVHTSLETFRGMCDRQMCSALRCAVAGIQQTKLIFAEASEYGDDD
jgi:hypothetical protein